MKIFFCSLSFFVLLFCANSSYAFKAGGGLPVYTTFTDYNGLNSSNVSGVSLSLELPFFFGFGLNSWDYKLKTKDKQSINASLQLYDIFYSLPVPFINLSAGLGIGTFQIKSTENIKYDSKISNQFFVKLGYDVLPLIGINLGYHVVNIGKVKSNAGTTSSFNNSVISLGAEVGF